jgi:hypothetical protein
VVGGSLGRDLEIVVELCTFRAWATGETTSLKDTTAAAVTAAAAAPRSETLVGTTMNRLVELKKSCRGAK